MSTRFSSGTSQTTFLIEIFSLYQLGYKLEVYGGMYSMTPLKSEFAQSREELGRVVDKIVLDHHLKGQTFTYKYLDKAK